jgi:hypothetical protein
MVIDIVEIKRALWLDSENIDKISNSIKLFATFS